jgi:hypothetical protein
MSLRMRLEVQKLDTPYKVAFNRIMRYYGAGCFPQKEEDSGNLWRVPIGVHYPSSVVDQKTNIERIFTFHFDNIGEFLLEKPTLRVKSRPSLGDITRAVGRKRKELSQKVEDDFIKIIGDPKLKIRFEAMKYAHLGIQPIYRTLTRLLEAPDRYPTRGWVEQIGYEDLVNLIVDIGYAEYSEEGKLRPTNELKSLLEDTMKGDIARTKEAVIGLVLAKHFDYLYKTKRIIHFVPYVRTSTTYYSEAIQYGSLIHVTENSLQERIRKYYRVPMSPTPKARFGYPTIIKELLNAEILCQDKNYIVGRGEIFEELLHIRDNLPMSEPAYP